MYISIKTYINANNEFDLLKVRTSSITRGDKKLVGTKPGALSGDQRSLK